MKQYYINSTKFSIYERKTKKNGTVYDIRFRVIPFDTGEEVNKKMSGFKTKTAAREAHTDFITEYCVLTKGNPLREKKEKQEEAATVGELFSKYISSLGDQNKESSKYDKIKVFEAYILPKYKDEKITVLTKEELYRWQDEMWAMKNPRTKEYFSYSYKEKTRAHFSSFLSWVESRYGFENNFKYVKKPKRTEQKDEIEFWTQEEFQKFIDAVDDTMYHCLFTMMFYSGRRKGEYFALSQESILPNGQIDFSNSVTRKTMDGSPYKVTSTKKGKKQVLPVCKVIQEELERYQWQSPFLFGGERPLAENTVTRKLKYYAKLAGVKPLHPHGLRHSFVSLMIHKGVNLFVIAQLIGDTVEQVTKTYGHMYKSDLYKAVNLIDE